MSVNRRRRRGKPSNVGVRVAPSHLASGPAPFLLAPRRQIDRGAGFEQGVDVARQGLGGFPVKVLGGFPVDVVIPPHRGAQSRAVIAGLTATVASPTQPERQAKVKAVKSTAPKAKREATRDGAPAIDLIDGDSLCELLKQLKIGVSIRTVEEIEVVDNYFQTI